MNLIGRLLLLLIRALFRRGSAHPLDAVSLTFRVWPHDIDVNMHLTAARYFSFGDLCRTQWMFDIGQGWAYVTSGYRVVLNAQEMTYIREFRPFSQLELRVQLVCWDEKYGYFEQRFYHRGQLYSVGHARVAVVKDRQVFSLDDVFRRFGVAATSPPETEAVTDWKATLAAKRKHFS